MNKWKYFFPDDEELDDARDFPASLTIYDAEDAAQEACRLDYDRHDGWQRRGNTAFPINIVSPDGTVFFFRGWHEATVEHFVAEGN
jgi:hypothetical protein